MNEMQSDTSSLRPVANVLTLVGAILETIACALLTLSTLGLFGILTIPLIVLAWLAYNQTKAFAKGWNIYGIVQAVCFCDMLGLAGYILALIDLTSREKENTCEMRPAYPDIDPQEAELNRVKAEIAGLKRKNAEKRGNYNG